MSFVVQTNEDDLFYRISNQLCAQFKNRASRPRSQGSRWLKIKIIGFHQVRDDPQGRQDEQQTEHDTGH